MPTKQELLAELERRGVFNSPEKAPLVAELRRRGVLPAAPAQIPPPNPSFQVSSRTSTLNVPADKTGQAVGEMGQQFTDVTRKVAPVAVPLAMGMTLGPGAGFAARTGMAGLSGAAGEATRQIADATSGRFEASPIEAAKKIGETGATAAALSVGGEAAAGAIGKSLQGVRNVSRTFLDFLADVRRGTAMTAGKLPKKALAGGSPSPEDVKIFAQSVSDSIGEAKQNIGKSINEALAASDSSAPAGSIPFRAVANRLIGLRKNLRVDESIPGVDQNVTKAVDQIGEYLGNWLRQNGTQRQNLTLQEAKDLVDRVRSAIPFDATNPGAAKAAFGRLKPFSEWLRGEVGKKSPAADKALKQFQDLIEASDAIDSTLGIQGGEKITLSRIGEIENSLKKLLRQSDVKRSVEETALTRVGAKPELLQQGQGLAIRKELTETGGASSGGQSIFGLPTQLLRSATSPVTRAAFGPASRLADALRIPEGVREGLRRGTSPLAGVLAAALSKKGKKNESAR